MNRKERVASWRKQLMNRIKDEVTPDRIAELVWLVRHLEEYLERWLAFARLQTVNLAATLDNDVFCIVLAASDLIDERLPFLSASQRFPQQEWRDFRSAVQWIQKAPDQSELDLISETFQLLSEKLTNKE
jgi:hypothetical protein